MARYIDAELFADRLLNAWDTADKEKKSEIVAILSDIVTPILVGTPTADVVPRAEVEKLHEVIFKKEDLMQKIAEERNKYADELEVVKDTNEHLKAEVAREIFEEIEKILNDERINRKLAERGFLFVRHGEPTFEQRFAELKKKYTEGQK